MTAEQFRQVERLFDALFPLPPDQRDIEWNRVAPVDPDVRSRVIELLGDASNPSRSGPSDVSVMFHPVATHVQAVCDELLPPGTMFEGYIIREFLGKGGYGRVYKAEERSGIRRTVALKIISPGVDTHDALARFAQERQLLANMDHPNIARIIRADKTEAGRPYFAMEYVPGVPITEFTDQNRLSIRDRLHLFLDVCEAIAHAHRKLVIHRDIKPGNILAYLFEGKPRIKVIDFGIAKSLAGDGVTLQSIVNTARNDVIGTPESMSPEQAEGRPDIDTLTDVYSLGLLLYELLAGVKAFDPERFRQAGPLKARHIIIEETPPRPSTHIRQLSQKGEAIAAARRTELPHLADELERELEWIPLMALRKERDRRYASVSALADDIRRYLANKPLQAAPESIGYRTKKWLRRNRTQAVASMSFIALIIFSVAFYIHGVRAEQAKTQAALDNLQRQRAETESEHLRTVEMRRRAALTLASLLTEYEKANNYEAVKRLLPGTVILCLDAESDARHGLTSPLTTQETSLLENAVRMELEESLDEASHTATTPTAAQRAQIEAALSEFSQLQLPKTTSPKSSETQPGG